MVDMTLSHLLVGEGTEAPCCNQPGLPREETAGCGLDHWPQGLPCGFCAVPWPWEGMRLMLAEGLGRPGVYCPLLASAVSSLIASGSITVTGGGERRREEHG